MTARIVRALFVDEAHNDRLALLRLFNGYASAIVASVAEALEELARGEIDLVVIGCTVSEEAIDRLLPLLGEIPYLMMQWGGNGLQAQASWLDEAQLLVDLKPLPSLIHEMITRISASTQEAEEGKGIPPQYKSVVTVNEDNLVEGLSPAAETMFQYRSREVLGRESELLLPLCLPAPDRGETAFETVAVRKDGSRFPVEVMLDQLYWQGRRCYIVTLRDLAAASDPLSLIEEYAIRDELTGLYHRRSLRWMLADALKRSDQYGLTVALLMVDILHLDLINEMHGREVGDQVLAGVAKVIASELRDVDRVVRFGGDELLVILQQSSESKAMATAERIRRFIDHNPFTVRREGQQVPVRVSVTIGAAFYPQNGGSIETLLDAAHRALRSGHHRPAEGGTAAEGEGTDASEAACFD